MYVNKNKKSKSQNAFRSSFNFSDETLREYFEKNISQKNKNLMGVNTTEKHNEVRTNIFLHRDIINSSKHKCVNFQLLIT